MKEENKSLSIPLQFSYKSDNVFRSHDKNVIEVDKERPKWFPLNFNRKKTDVPES